MMWTPATAMLWEYWRMSRRNLAIGMTIVTFLGWAFHALEEPVRIAIIMAVLLATVGQGWAAALDKRNRLVVLALGYTRPVATWKLVLVTLAFVAIASAVTYLAPVAIIGTAFDIPVPLLPMAALCATVSVAWVTFLWQTADLVLRRITGVIMMFGWFWATPTVFASGAAPIVWRFSAGAYAAMAITCAVASAMAVFGVARQRRGDSSIAQEWLASIRSGSRTRHGHMSFLSHLRMPCPVSSPALAQLWFEFHTVGRRIVTSGAIAALLFLLASLASPSIEVLIVWVWTGVALPVLVAVRSLLGLQRKQGHARLDVFAAARPIGTARLVALKVLAGSLALYAGWAVFAAGLWVFDRWIADPATNTWAIIVDYFTLIELGIVDGPKGSPPGMPNAAVSAAVVLQLTAVVVGAAAFHARFVLHAKRIMLGALAVMLYTVLIVTLVSRGWIAGVLFYELHVAVLAAAAVIGTSLVLWRGHAERIVSARGVAFIVGIGIALGIVANIAWMNTGDSIADWSMGLLLGLMPLYAMAFAPWSFSRMRHR